MTVFDIDAALAEAEGTPLRLRLLGQEWDVPASPPAAAMAKAHRAYVFAARIAQRVAAGELSDEEALKLEIPDLDPLAMLEEFVGAELVNKWLELGLTSAQVKATFGYLWRTYNGRPEKEGDEAKGEAAAPAEGA